MDDSHKQVSQKSNGFSTLFSINLSLPDNSSNTGNCFTIYGFQIKPMN